MTDTTAKIREALAWYANRLSNLQDDIDYDGFGKRAREALALLDAERPSVPIRSSAVNYESRLVDACAQINNWADRPDATEEQLEAILRANFPEDARKPAPTDEKALEALKVVYDGNELAAERGESIKNWPTSYARKLAREVLYPSLAREAPKDESKEGAR